MQKIEIPTEIKISPVMLEEFRSLNSSLQFSAEKPQIICVTSTYPNEGKSFVSLNLARIMAEGNKKSLLIDADMRNSDLYKDMEFEKDITGLSSILSKQCEMIEGIYSTTDPGFFLIPIGPISPNPTALLRNGMLEVLLQTARKVFDFIIIDSPPIGMVTDAAIIASACDSSVLVVASGMESKNTVRKSISMLQQVNENFSGVILNKVNQKNGNIYGKYGHYGKYGNVYGE